MRCIRYHRGMDLWVSVIQMLSNTKCMLIMGTPPCWMTWLVQTIGIYIYPWELTLVSRGPYCSTSWRPFLKVAMMDQPWDMVQLHMMLAICIYQWILLGNIRKMKLLHHSNLDGKKILKEYETGALSKMVFLPRMKCVHMHGWWIQWLGYTTSRIYGYE